MIKKRYYFVAVLLILIILFLLFGVSRGPEIRLSSCQSINSPGNYLLIHDVSSDSECFNITSDNVLFNGNGYKVYSSKDFQVGGISLYNVKNVTVKNTIAEGYEVGILAFNSNHISLINNTLIKDLEGVVLYNVNESTLDGNTIEDSANIGIALEKSKNNKIQNNKISFGLEPIYAQDSQNNEIKSNFNTNNLNHDYFRFQRNKSSTYQSGVPINFSIILSDEIDKCTTCTYDIKLNPSDDPLSLKKEGNLTNAMFIPTRTGIYSIELKVTDQYGNLESSKYTFLINATKEDKEDYYVRGVDPTHGQAHSLGLYHADSGSLLLTPPTQNETRICSDWVQVSPDELPKYLLGEVKEVDFSLTYNHASNNSYVGVQRTITEDEQVDQSVKIDETTENPITKAFSFKVDWKMNYYWQWYWQAIKLSAQGSNPTLFINQAHPDKASFTYIYSSTPAIRALDNPNIIILSATMKDEISNESSIVLTGDGKTNLTVEMPNKNNTYQATYNNKSCKDKQCSMIKQENGMITLMLNVENESNLKIFA